MIIIKSTVQAVLFRTGRAKGLNLWFYRPGPSRHLSFPSYGGSGNSLTLYLRLSLPGRIILEGSLTRLSYYDRFSIGSGRDETEGPDRYTALLQLRKSF